MLDYRCLLQNHFKLGKTHLEDISRHNIMRRIDRLSSTPSEQHHAFVIARIFFKWAVRNHYNNHGPLDGISPPPKTQARDHVLTEKELGSGPIDSFGATVPLQEWLMSMIWSSLDRKRSSVALFSGFLSGDGG